MIYKNNHRFHSISTSARSRSWMNCRRSLQGGLFVAGWENRIGVLGGGLLVRAFRPVSICKVVPLVPTGFS